MTDSTMGQTGGLNLVGRTLADRYVILEQIGQGGMSVVYRARHTLIKKIVAIKVLREELSVQQEALARFQREAMAAASIGNPHIVDITDYGFIDEGNAFIVMEHLEGQDLKSTIETRGALDARRSVSIARQILDALSSAHEQGIIHRDLKGGNIFLTRRDGEEFVKLLDFGISKVLQPISGLDEQNLTTTGVVMGTPQYLSPEQAHGDVDIDHRSDIYSMGVILYEMLTGRLPFKGKSVLDLLIKHIQEPPVPPRRVRPDLEISADLERVVLKALQKKPGDRFASAREMLEALPEPADLSGSVIDTRRGRGRGLLLAALLVVGLAGLSFWLLRHEPAGTGADALSGSTSSDAPLADAHLVVDHMIQDMRRPDMTSTVTLEIGVLPARARIFVDDALLGVGRISREVPRGKTPLLVRITARGYRSRQLALIPSTDRKVTVELQPKKQRPPAKRPADLLTNPYRDRAR